MVRVIYYIRLTTILILIFRHWEPIKFNLETKMSCNYNKMIYKILMFGCWATHPPKKTFTCLFTCFVNKRKENVFLKIRKGKHFPGLKCIIFLWPEFEFLWLVFLIVVKHWKVGKMVSRKMNSWKQTRHKVEVWL
jgi:hypothetical protein